MAGRDNDSAFRPARRDWINDRTSRRDDDDVARSRLRSRSRGRDSPFSGQGDWRNRRSRSPIRDRSLDRGRLGRVTPDSDRGRTGRVTPEADSRKNPFPTGRDKDSDGRFDRNRDFERIGRSPSGEKSRESLDRGHFDRNRSSPNRSPSRSTSYNNDNRSYRGRRSRDRSVEKSDGPWSGRDRFQRDRRIPERNSRESSMQSDRNFERSKSPKTQLSATEKFVDNWGRELRLGGGATCDKNSVSSPPPPKISLERDRVRRDPSDERNRQRRSRERDWKSSVDNFLGARGSRGSSPNWRSRGRDSPGCDPRRSDKTEEEWDREIRRFEKERTKPSSRDGYSRDRRSPSRERLSPYRSRRSPIRDRHSPVRDRRSPYRNRHSPLRRRSVGRRSRSRELSRRSRSLDRSHRSRSRDMIRSRSRDVKSRNRDLDRSPKLKPRDRTPVVDESMEGEDMVISDDDNNEETTKVSVTDDWETQNILKFTKNNENIMMSSYKTSIPQKTVVIRCMPIDATEVDIHLDITSCNLVCHDIRLVRRKDTGSSRGFAFVEFYNVDDAVTWMELRQGTLMLNKTRCLMEYSTPRDNAVAVNQPKYINDWICNKCQAHNFSKRFLCFVCNATRTYRDVEGSDLHASDHPTNTVVLLGLDVLTSEEIVLKSIASLSNLPIRSVKIARDPFTNISKGGCYLEMNNVVDAFNLFNTLKSNVPEIDGKTPDVKYARLDVNKIVSQAVSILPKSATGSGKIGNAAIAAAQWSHQVAGMTHGQYTLADVPKLAECSAAMYATTPSEKMAYYNYYQAYYKKQIAEGIPIALPQHSATGLATAQAALAASKTEAATPTPLEEPPDGSGTATYPMPDTSVYQYDASSGFYYDPFTKLYYDANSQYYFNNKLSKYLYWDGTRSTYLPAPTSAEVPEMSQASSASGAIIVGAPQPAKAEEKKKEKEGDNDRVKVAKRIAKDMEKWAKTLNQKKETAKQNMPATTAASAAPTPAPVSFSVGTSGQSRLQRETGAADIGFSVLERKDSLSNLGIYYKSLARNAPNPTLAPAPVQLPPTVDSDEEDEYNEDKSHTDWDKLVCLLCKRQLGSREALLKHQQMSDLHKQNLAAWYRSKGLDPDDEQVRKNQYRDRASERRQKYGVPDTPKPSRLKESYIKARDSAYEQPTTKGIGTENLGNKLLQKMGWQEGMGLGKKNQGRTSIIEAKARSTTAGLGTRSTGVTPGPGETYKECVKKMMAARYAQLDER